MIWSVAAVAGVAVAAFATLASRGRVQAPAPVAGEVLEAPAHETCAAARYPGAEWARAKPADAGWSPQALAHATEVISATGFAAALLVYDGRIVWEYGDIGRAYPAKSIRKSLYNAVIGQLVAERKLALDATLAQLGVDDQPPLTTAERSATLRDLLMSRSGIYHDAAYMTRGDFDERPARGAHRPGEHFWYNNWDFNVLGSIAERAAGGDLFAAFDARIARPLRMQDYTAASGTKRNEDVSMHPAYLFDLSARDRARFGWLYLQHGCWMGEPLVPAEWVATSTAPLTDRSATNEMSFGYLWWSQPSTNGVPGRQIMARGNANQYITLLPDVGVVIVVINDMSGPGWTNWIRARTGGVASFDDYIAVRNALLEARPRQDQKNH